MPQKIWSNEQKSKPVSLTAPINGVLREFSVDEVSSPANSLQEAVNLNFDAIGAVQLRPGWTLLGGNVSAGNCNGLHYFVDNAFAVPRLLAGFGSSIFAYNGTNWLSALSGLSGSRYRFTNFLNLAYVVDGNANDIVRTYNGTTFGTTNVASLPKGDFIENYRDVVWVADSATDKLYYSDVVNSNQTLTGGTNFIQIAPQDGSKITGLKKYPQALLVFKYDFIYRVFSTGSTDPDPAIFRGTYSQESIVKTKNGLYYHHPSGFYQFVIDGEQVEISRPVQDFVKNISRANYTKIVGWDDGDHVMWSVGSVTISGVTFVNVVLRYTISTQVWTIYSYPEQVLAASIYDDGTANYIQTVGGTAGSVYQYDTGKTDNGSVINYSLITHPFYITGLKSIPKRISQLAALSENATGAFVEYQIDDWLPDVWAPIGTINVAVACEFNFETEEFKRIRFRISGSSSGDIFRFRGWEILKWLASGDPAAYHEV